MFYQKYKARQSFRVLVGICTMLVFGSLSMATECFTPLSWQPKLTDTPLDLNKNYIDDYLEELTTPQTDVVLSLNACPLEEDLERLAQFGRISFLSSHVSVMVLRDVRVDFLPELALDERVAFVGADQEYFPTLDVASAAMRVRSSTVYANSNIEDVYALDGSGINIAIIDSGVDDQAGPGVTHESFPNTKFVGGYDATTGTFTNPDDSLGHGTHVAGIALGTGGTSGTYRGIAPGSGLIDVKVFGSGSTTLAIVLDALEVVMNQRVNWNIKVVNMSLGNCLSSNGTGALAVMVNRAVFEGLVVVASSGNTTGCGLPPNGQLIAEPGAADDAICVGNVDDQGSILRSFLLNPTSQTGPRLSDGDVDSSDERKPELTAPGTNIRSARNDTTGNYVNATGTSMAAPMVAGCAALILEKNPALPPLSLKQLLIDTAEDYGPSGWDGGFGNGVIDCFAAVDKMVSTAGTDLCFEVYIGKPGKPDWWASPDLYPTDPVVVQNTPNTINAKITNKGPNSVTGFLVNLGVYNFGNGDSDYHICTVPVTQTLASGSSLIVSCNYTPAPVNGTVHACLKAEIIYPFDTDFTNNRAQHNINIRQTRSPARFNFQVNNPTNQPLTMNLMTTLTEETAGWEFVFDQNNFRMEANDCPRDIQFELIPVGEPGQTTSSAEASVEIRGITDGGEILSLGGVVMIGQLRPDPTYEKTRLISHVTRPLDFETQVFISNPDSITQYYTFRPYDEMGVALPEISGSLEAGETQCFPSIELFGRDDVSHFQIADESPFVTIAYQAVGFPSPAHLGESNISSKRWRMFPGEWAFAFDGFAAVNTGDDPAGILVRHYDKAGTLLDERRIPAIAAWAKTRFVTSNAFNPVVGSYFEISSDQPLAVTALRGTQPFSGVDYLWQVALIPLD